MSISLELERKFRVKTGFNLRDVDIVKSSEIEQHYLLTDVSNVEIDEKNICITATDGSFLSIQERNGNRFFISFGESRQFLTYRAVTYKFYKGVYDFITQAANRYPNQFNKMLADVRIRSKGKSYLMTLKSAGKEARDEFEDDITHELFDLLTKLSCGVILKIRYVTSTNEEIDIYDASTPLAGLITMEREFKDYEGYNAYVIPNYVLDEVTADDDMKNKALALNGLPVRYQVS